MLRRRAVVGFVVVGCLCLVHFTTGDLVKAVIRNAFTDKGKDFNGIDCKDNTTHCQSNYTCCKATGEIYGCCDLPKAVCCADEKSCCPDGYKCDLEHRRCYPGPDGSPVPIRTVTTQQNKATCCGNGNHCCPSGSKCNLETGRCDPDEEVIPMQSIVPTQVSDVICPDGQSQCPTGTTCCKLSTGQYGCCPFLNAVCCNDGKHCCPQGYTCDVSAGTCSKKGEMLLKVSQIFAAKVSDVACLDGQSHCPTGTTCCKLFSGQYGCCPLPDAVCCNDEEHCCPQGYTCDVSAGTCSKKEDMVLKASIMLTAKASDVVCPDGSSRCPTGTTCCKLAGEQAYGCCPFVQAVCCSDGLHCCQQGYTCDLSAGTCTKNGAMMVIALEKSSSAEVTNIVRPDGKSSCPTGTTCCELSSGDYGCCPFPNAVCCNDGVHCCPQGYSCDVVQGTCTKKGELLMKALENFPAKVSSVIICSDGYSICPIGTTCCQLRSGQYGCCPFPDAVCCIDQEYCCQGYTCDASVGCTKGEFVAMKPVAKIALKVPNLICPDGTSSCPTGTTCCKLSSGSYGCCPFPNAVCCNDGEHCCPQGYTCDVAQGTCTKKGELPMKALEKFPAKESAWNIICPGARKTCSDGQTCCHSKDGSWDCCPHPDAVCCSDGMHCCPHEHTCSRGGGCTQLDKVAIRAALRLPAIDTGSKFLPLKPSKTSLEVIMQKLFGNGGGGDNCVMCPDDSECPNFNTCCQLADGKYGCCKYPSGVCCTDHTHCCRHGFYCDSKHTLCIQEGLQEPMTKMSFTGRDEFAVESSQSFDEM